MTSGESWQSADPVVVSETANKVVDQPIENFLDMILTREEDGLVKQFFSKEVPLSEKMLALVDSVMDSILSQAFEFLDN
uniref:DUF4378 domain-containing protein n=1 Tax=Ascaris lumbricoides TaxID=6252 RepID=A0A0M3HT72_ASCLU